MYIACYLYLDGVPMPVMKIQEKLNILAEAARYDASCVSSGSARRNNLGGIGNVASDSRRDIGQSASRGMTEGRQIRVKVECPDC